MKKIISIVIRIALLVLIAISVPFTMLKFAPAMEHEDFWVEKNQIDETGKRLAIIAFDLADKTNIDFVYLNYTIEEMMWEGWGKIKTELTIKEGENETLQISEKNNADYNNLVYWIKQNGYDQNHTMRNKFIYIFIYIILIILIFLPYQKILKTITATKHLTSKV